MVKLTTEQILFVRSAVSKWLSIYHKHHSNEATPPTPADADHSALLFRLLEGNPPLDKPPPKRFSYPCYDLGEGREVEIREYWANDDIVVIDQCRDWTIVKDESMINALKHWWGHEFVFFLQHTNGDYFALYENRGIKFLKRVL